MKLIIDRFEGGIAVCEDASGEQIDLDRELLPPNATVGSVLVGQNNVFAIDVDETSSRRLRISELENILFD